MLSCKQTTQLVSNSMDQKLSLAQRIGLKLHLLICHYCRNYTRHLRFISRAAKKFDQHIENQGPTLSVEAQKKLTQALRNHDQS